MMAQEKALSAVFLLHSLFSSCKARTTSASMIIFFLFGASFVLSFLFSGGFVVQRVGVVSYSHRKLLIAEASLKQFTLDL